MGVLRVKLGVELVGAPAGFRLIAQFVAAAAKYGDLTISSGADGIHSGPDDPHHSGNAYDVRSHDLAADLKQTILMDIMTGLQEEVGELKASSGGFVTDKFFGWIEDAGGPNEHYHFQLRHGVEFP